LGKFPGIPRVLVHFQELGRNFFWKTKGFTSFTWGLKVIPQLFFGKACGRVGEGKEAKEPGFFTHGGWWE